jgi:tight adherence protein C
VGAALGKAAPALSAALKPKSEFEEGKLKAKLANAGFNSVSAPTTYLAIRVATLIVGVLIGSSYGFFSYGIAMKSLYPLLFIGAFGFYAPALVLAYMCMKRKEKIFLALPDALDLLVVCVEAGLGLDAGLRRVSDELIDTHQEVCQEFQISNMQLQMGRVRHDVLHDLGLRTGVDDMRALAAILIQADKFGSSIAQALKVQSDSMRIKRSQMAEERAAKTAVKMIFPLVLFIFPGIFVVLVGPAAIIMMSSLLK